MFHVRGCFPCMSDNDDEGLSGPKFKKSKSHGHGSGFWSLNRILFMAVFIMGIIIGTVLTPLVEPLVYPEKARLEKDLQDYKAANQYFDHQVDCLVQAIEASTLAPEDLKKCGV